MTQDADSATAPAVRNVVKCRNDAGPVFLERAGTSPDGQPAFALAEGPVPNWAKAGDVVGPDKLRAHIEPWLTALCQSEHLSLLLGSGLFAGSSSAGHRKGAFPECALSISATLKLSSSWK